MVLQRVEEQKKKAEEVLAELRRKRESRVEEFRVKYRKFSDRVLREERVNQTIFVGVLMLEIFMLLKTLGGKAYGTGVQGGTAYVVIALLLVGAAAAAAGMLKLRKSRLFRYAVYGSFFLAYGLVAVVSENVTDIFLAIPMLSVTALYYDIKFTRRVVLLESAVCLLRLAARGSAGKIDNTELGILFIMIMFLVTVMRTTVLVRRFEHDAHHTMLDEKKVQELMMEDILSTADTVSKGTDAVAEIVNNLRESSNIVYNSLQEIATGTQMTAENVQQQTVMTQQIQEAIGAARELSQETVKLAQNSAGRVEENLGVMEQMKRQAEKINGKNTEASESMRKLQEKTKEVQDITGVIFSISKQTNLLALNASIESARAGEAGKSFAVVAEQIRELAEQTRKSTEDIARIIGELRDNAGEAAENVEASVRSAEQQKQLIDDASKSFAQISRDMGMLSGNVDEADQKISALASSNDTIVENISQLSATSEEITANSQEATGISRENSADADRATLLLGEVLQTVKQLERYHEQGK